MKIHGKSSRLSTSESSRMGLAVQRSTFISLCREIHKILTRYIFLWEQRKQKWFFSKGLAWKTFPTISVLLWTKRRTWSFQWWSSRRKMRSWRNNLWKRYWWFSSRTLKMWRSSGNLCWMNLEIESKLLRLHQILIDFWLVYVFD